MSVPVLDDIADSRSSPTKRRRSRAEIDAIKAAIYGVLEADHPMTVRQVFYRLVSEDTVAKTEGEYKGTVSRLLVEMRLAGEIPFGWIGDNTRWMRKPDTHSSLETFLDETAQLYRRDLWDEQDTYVEIWLEKDALAGVLYEITEKWDVPLMVTRGYASLTYLYEAAEAIRGRNKPAFLYYFGDHDPSGIDIPRTVEARLREFAPKAEIRFERVAVTPDQIRRWKLPTRPTKHADTRSKGFEGESIEVDAIPPRRLRRLVAKCIERHVDRHALEVTQRVEAEERRSLEMLVQHWQGEE